MMQGQTSSELKEAVAGLRPYFVRAAWFNLVYSLLLLTPTAYMLVVYERVVNSRSHTTLAILTILVIGAYIAMEIVDWVRSQQLHAGGLALDFKLSERLFGAMFEANLRQLNVGSAQSLSDLRTIRSFMSSSAMTAAMEAPLALLFLGLIFAISPVLGYVALAAAVAQALIGWLNERSTQPPLQQAGLQGYGAQLYASTTMRFAQVIESMGMVGIIYHRWIQKRRDFLALQAVASVKAGWYQSLSRLTQTMVGSALLGVSCWLLLHNKLNGGAAMLIIGGILGGRALTPLVQLIAQWRSIVGVRLAWKRVDALLSALPPRPVGLSLPSPKGVLQVEDVYAAGPGSQIPILRGISFSLRPGEALAIIGPSASGKTTLARLLIGIWPAASGKVRLDMVDVFAWNKTELGPHIGYLPQAVELFEGTIAENIARFGDLEPDKLHAATAAVGLDGIISQLPLGLNTPVGSDGSMLSGGMRQRVGIARAIYGNPAFVVLDEPNSSLDEAGDTALANAIATMKSRGTTVVVITHRNTLLSVVDKLLVLQAGRIQAFGPVEQVLAEMPQVGGPNPLIENNQSTGSPA